MARRRSRQRMRTAKRGRLLQPVARRQPALAIRVSPVDLRAFEDRRVWSPQRLRWPSRLRGIGPVFGPMSIGAVPARVVETRSGLFRGRMSFDAPRSVLICVRRKRRREVLHALKLKRSGGGKRRNEWSKVEC